MHAVAEFIQAERLTLRGHGRRAVASHDDTAVECSCRDDIVGTLPERYCNRLSTL